MSRSIEMIETVAARLESISWRFVFLGGATTELYVTDSAVTDIRPTMDVDVIVEIGTFAKYAALEQSLRDLGLQQMIGADTPICRWQIGDVLVDVMPTNEQILGFSNRWYEQAIGNAHEYALPSQRLIWLANPEYFIATKLEAFLGRGNEDYILSHDIEDIITVIDGRPQFRGEIELASESVRTYICRELARHRTQAEFRDAVQGYVPNTPSGNERYRVIFQRIEAIIATGI